ncbi:MAG: hypothetical protein LBR88_06685 [Zoogloeaceae bacterium]|jgi:hypothetical protein|nr:hypothetical protein [Zoogloeaceae bacterium]
MSAIPKKIHYCWFGGKPLPLQAQRCLASWTYWLPDYDIVRWDEKLFDPQSHPFTHAAYQAGTFAFVSDYVRMIALYRDGGIYLDTDVEALASLDTLLEHDFFIGLEAPQRFATSVIGAKPGHWLPKAMLDWYDRTPFESNAAKTLVNVNEVSRLLLAHGFSGKGGDECLGGEHVLEIGRLSSVKSTSCIWQPMTRHWYAGSWRNHAGKGIGSRTWRKIRKLPGVCNTWLALQGYRIRRWMMR